MAPPLLLGRVAKVLTASGKNTPRGESPTFLGAETYSYLTRVLARGESRARAREAAAKHAIKKIVRTQGGTVLALAGIPDIR